MDLIKLFKYLTKRDVCYAGAGIVFIVCQAWMELKVPDYMSAVTVLVETKGSAMSEVLAAGGIMMLCTLGSLVSAVIVGFATAKVAAGFSMRLRGAVYDKVMDLSMEEIGRFSTPSLITRSTNDITQVMMFVAVGLKSLVRAPLMGAWAIAKIAGKSWAWSTATAIAVVVMLAMMITILSLVKPKFMIIQSLTDNLNRVTRENLSGIRVVRAYNAEDYQEKKFDQANEELTATNLFTQRVMSFNGPGMTLIMSLLTLSIYWIGMVLINGSPQAERLTLFSEMVVFFSYAMQVIMSFMMLTMTLLILPRALVSTKRINEVLVTKPSIVDGNNISAPGGQKGKIEFRNVSFTYPEASEPILRDISFEAEPGQTVAIIGATGSGKSTLINLIPRFYDATKGDILVDGINVKDYKQEMLRSKIGYVSQKAVLFTGTIRSNVTFGNLFRMKDDRGIEEAIKVAQADEFISSMEGGLDAPVSQGGTNLSGGQKQRLSIARAVFRNPGIYIFDDSFSALDFKTDRAVRSALKEKTKGATILIVAQRIGTIMDADRIIVLDEGRIVGMGTHKELLETCGIYREIAQSQLSKEEMQNAG